MYSRYSAAKGFGEKNRTETVVRTHHYYNITDTLGRVQWLVARELLIIVIYVIRTPGQADNPRSTLSRRECVSIIYPSS